MARKNKAKRTKIKQEVVPPAVNDNKQTNKPTPERTAHNDFRTVGMAMQLVPPIVRLHEQGLINDREFAALAYYRDQAGLADKSPVKSCLDWTPKGGHGPGIAIISAQRETWRLEQNMGALWAMCRAICVDDVTVEGWYVCPSFLPTPLLSYRYWRQAFVRGPVAVLISQGLRTSIPRIYLLAAFTDSMSKSLPFASCPVFAISN